jgi:hypothetical protein
LETPPDVIDQRDDGLFQLGSRPVQTHALRCGRRREREGGMSVETSDGYARLVAQLSPDWRVIQCRDRLQWILQRSPKMSRRDDWRARSYCQTREALIRCAREYAGAVDAAAMATLIALPASIEVDTFTNAEVQHS